VLQAPVNHAFIQKFSLVRAVPKELNTLYRSFVDPDPQELESFGWIKGHNIQTRDGNECQKLFFPFVLLGINPGYIHLPQTQK
jgi:hypothetical protein